MSEPEISAEIPPRTLGRRNALIVIAVAICVIVATLGYRTSLNEHEVFAAEPAREMLDGGSWVLQPFAGAFRVKKPPGQSWLIATSLFVTQTQNEFTARLPSAVAGTALALLLGAIGARLSSRRVGLIAALMTVTTHVVQVRSRLAEADMALALTIAAAYASVLWAMGSLAGGERVGAFADSNHAGDVNVPSPQPSPRGRGSTTLIAATAFWLALTAGIFLKGPIPLGFVLPPLLIGYAILRYRGDRDPASAIRRTVLHPIPIVLTVIVVGLWIAAALRLYPGIVNAWHHEVVDRASGEMRSDSPLAYFGLVPLAALPWFPFILAALTGGRAAWFAAMRRPAVLLLALWAGVGFVVISCVALKALHYTLPMLPPLILLAAVGFDRSLAWFLASRPAERRASLERTALIAWFGIASIAWIGNQLFLEPRKDRGDVVKQFAAEVDRAVPSAEPIYFVGVGEERTAWYLHHRLIQTRLLADDSLDVQIGRLPMDRTAYVLCRLPNEADLAKSASVESITRSKDYRGRGEAFEQRSLVRVTP